MCIGAKTQYAKAEFQVRLDRQRPPQQKTIEGDNAIKSIFLVIFRPGSGWLPGKPLAEQPLGSTSNTIWASSRRGSSNSRARSRTSTVSNPADIDDELKYLYRILVS